jgi:hypothetical protein
LECFWFLKFQHPVDFSERITPAGNAGAGPQSWQLLLGDW